MRVRARASTLILFLITHTHTQTHTGFAVMRFCRAGGKERRAWGWNRIEYSFPSSVRRGHPPVGGWGWSVTISFLILVYQGQFWASFLDIFTNSGGSVKINTEFYLKETP